MATSTSRLGFSSLSPEIARMVFGWACEDERVAYVCTPGTVATSPEYGPFSPPPLSSPFPASDSVRRKRTSPTLVRVCRSWRASANEFLYAHISVGSIKQAASLALVLERSRVSSHGGRSKSIGYGWWTRRLDYIPTDIYLSSRSRTLPNDFTRIVACCPNINVYTDVGTVPLSPSIPTMLQYSCPTNIKRIQFNFTETKNLVALQRLLPSCTRLESLVVYGGGKNTSLNPIAVSLPALHTLEVPTGSLLLRSATNWGLPALVNLSLFDMEEHQSVTSFLSMHGSKLKRLDVHRTQTALQTVDPPNQIQITDLLQLCPNLQDLIIDVPALCVPFTLSTPLSSVTSIQLRHLDPVACSRFNERVDQLLSSLVHGNFPKLEKVKMLGVSWEMFANARNIDGYGYVVGDATGTDDLFTAHLSETASKEHFVAGNDEELFAAFSAGDGVSSSGPDGWWDAWITHLTDLRVRVEDGSGTELAPEFSDSDEEDTSGE